MWCLSIIFVIVSISLQFGKKSEQLALFANFSGYEYQWAHLFCLPFFSINVILSLCWVNIVYCIILTSLWRKQINWFYLRIKYEEKSIWRNSIQILDGIPERGLAIKIYNHASTFPSSETCICVSPSTKLWYILSRCVKHTVKKKILYFQVMGHFKMHKNVTDSGVFKFA
jgi:hypothetical protein